MTLQQFEDGLKAAVPETYELAAPQGAKRFVVWHRYGFNSIHGDNRNQVNVPKVQIDIATNNQLDTIAEDVFAALWLMDLSYEIISDGYDPDYNAMRTILQLEVV